MKEWPKKGIAFFIYCLVHAIFLIFILPSFPDTYAGGWMPTKLIIYIVLLVISSIINTLYMNWFLGTQPDF